MSGRIQLRYPKCSKTIEQDRHREDPVQAMEMVIICQYLTASGKAVSS